MAGGNIFDCCKGFNLGGYGDLGDLTDERHRIAI